MATYVALLRAVNVGGTGKLPMKELKLMCEEAGFESVRTYIASGNVVFETGDSPDHARAILEKRLEAWAGKEVGVLVRTGREMADLVTANPFPDQPGNRVVVLFLDRRPPPDLEAGVSGLQDEQMRPAASEVFIHYPEGQGSSKLSFGSGFGLATARNMNTVAKLAEMAAGT
jgi:uncharacterized protein (DUF1697 family)